MHQRSIVALDPKVVNRIAAGEAITSPENAVKELLENSIDAGATRISIYIEKGGYSLIKIIDDGCGIQRSDLPIACRRHTTSKLREFNDLSTITTFGFRGEALFSISCVSHLKITTKTEDSDVGYYANFSNGEMEGGIKDIAATQGTIIEAQDLFYNYPLRLKSIKPISTSRNIADIVSKYAVIHPEIRFAVFVDRQEKVRTFGNSTPDKVLKLLFEVESSNTFFHIGFKLEGHVSVEMYLNNPFYPQPKHTNALFINGRLVTNDKLRKGIEEVYSSTPASTCLPFYFAVLSMPPQNVDVNIHPSKQVVCFLDEAEIIQAICERVKTELDEQIASSTSQQNLKRNKSKAKTIPKNALITEFSGFAAKKQKNSVNFPIPSSEFPLSPVKSQPPSPQKSNETKSMSQATDNLFLQNGISSEREFLVAIGQHGNIFSQKPSYREGLLNINNQKEEEINVINNQPIQNFVDVVPTSQADLKLKDDIDFLDQEIKITPINGTSNNYMEGITDSTNNTFEQNSKNYFITNERTQNEFSNYRNREHNNSKSQIDNNYNDGFDTKKYDIENMTATPPKQTESISQRYDVTLIYEPSQRQTNETQQNKFMSNIGRSFETEKTNFTKTDIINAVEKTNNKRNEIEKPQINTNNKRNETPRTQNILNRTDINTKRNETQQNINHIPNTIKKDSNESNAKTTFVSARDLHKQAASHTPRFDFSASALRTSYVNKPNPPPPETQLNPPIVSSECSVESIMQQQIHDTASFEAEAQAQAISSIANRVQTRQQKRSKMSIFSELKFEPIKKKRNTKPILDPKSQTIEQLLSSMKETIRPFRVVTLDSIIQLKEQLQQNEDRELFDMLHISTFCGFIGLRAALFKCGNSLFICSLFGLMKDYFYWKFLEMFANFTSITVDINVNECVSDDLQIKVKELLNDKNGLLSDYFSMNIESNGNVIKTMPKVGKFVPSLEAMPLFLRNIATKVNWESEMECFSGLMEEFAALYAFVEDDAVNVAKGKDQKEMSAIIENEIVAKEAKYVPSRAIRNGAMITEFRPNVL
ncbi:Mlh1a [Histomonas meleagridis]|uniref:Mlh1a n=1 Tax=Histomonas meleagridis TaxID=135588 RepID=UPI003559B3EC|nr:Mlh1a [Histomonas meleagridis]KAH0801490.1 Mlh1a [Histomonas meleagridis]